MSASRRGRAERRPAPALVLALILAVAGCRAAPAGPYRTAAVQAAAWIAASAVRGPDGTSWPAVPSDPRPATLDLYGGVPGVVLFFLQAHAATGAAAYLEEARAGADFLLAKMGRVEGTGLYEGLAGVAFALAETYEATKDEKYRRGFVEGLDRLKAAAREVPGGRDWGPTTDIISGAAGTGLLLVYAARATGDRAWLDLAAAAGRRLVELGRPEHGGLKWAMDPSFPRLMPNFSHGTAGIAYFLAVLYRDTGRREFLDAALAGARYLVAVANTEGDGCLVFHDEPDNKDLYYLGWCHGPVGTARLFVLLARVTGDRAWMDWVRRSARGLLQSGIPEQETPGFWNNAGICCGLAGVGEFFLDLYEELGDREYRAFAERVGTRLLAKAAVASGRMSWPQAEHRTRPDDLSAQTGYMQGAAGIGAFLLRLDASGTSRRGRRIILPDSPFGR